MSESMYKEENNNISYIYYVKNNLKNAMTDVSSKHQVHVQVLKVECAMITDDGTSYSKKLNLGCWLYLVSDKHKCAHFPYRFLHP